MGVRRRALLRHPLERVAVAVESFTWFMGWVAAASVLLIAVYVVADVVARYVFEQTLPATLAIVRYCGMPLVVFLALALAQRRSEHLNVTLLVDRLAPPGRRFVDAVASVLTAVVIGLVAWYGVIGALESTEVREAEVGIIDVPLWPFKWVAVLGLITFGAQACVGARQVWRGGRDASPHVQSGIDHEQSGHRS